MRDLHTAYSLTPELRRLLDAWDAGVANEAPLSRHRWADIALWPAARSATVAASTAIEGNPLTFEEVDAALAGLPVNAPRDAVREVVNYNLALDLANRAALREDFAWSTELLRRLNGQVMQGLEDDESGEYRTQPVVVGGVYHPPEAAHLPGLTGELVEWIQTDARALHPLLRAALVHVNVVSIHPWLNGNGRTARVAGSLSLMRDKIAAPELVNVESWLRAHPDDYVDALQASHGHTYDPGRHSATPWLELFARISVSRLDARERLFAAIPNDIGLLTMALVADGLPADAAPILLAVRLGVLRTSRLAAGLRLSPSRVRAVLGGLVRAGWLEAVGERRGRAYRPSTRLMAIDLRVPAIFDLIRAGDET